MHTTRGRLVAIKRFLQVGNSQHSDEREVNECTSIFLTAGKELPEATDVYHLVVVNAFKAIRKRGWYTKQYIGQGRKQPTGGNTVNGEDAGISVRTTVRQAEVVYELACSYVTICVRDPFVSLIPKKNMVNVPIELFKRATMHKI